MREFHKPLFHIESMGHSPHTNQYDRFYPCCFGTSYHKGSTVLNSSRSLTDGGPLGGSAVIVEQIGRRIDLDMGFIVSASRIATHREHSRIWQQQSVGVIKARELHRGGRTETVGLGL